MIISRKLALSLGLAAVAAILAQQAFNSFSCYHHSLLDYLGAVGIFLLIPLLPALVSLLTANPLRAVGACLLLSPWLWFAYYTDCVIIGIGAFVIPIREKSQFVDATKTKLLREIAEAMTSSA